jgi:hypothetical protein
LAEIVGIEDYVARIIIDSAAVAFFNRKKEQESIVNH